jgi:MFS family permease
MFDIVSGGLYIEGVKVVLHGSRYSMAYEEKRAWITLVVSVVAYVIYLVVVLGRAGGGAIGDVDYVGPLLWSVGGAIGAGIVGGIVAGIVSGMSTGAQQKDERDREIGRLGDYIGQSFVVIGGVGALLMAMFEVGYFWIANTVYLCFFLSAVLGSIAKIVAYRRGFQSW